MFVKLKNQSHIDTTKVISIASDGDKHTLKMQNGWSFDVTNQEFPWLVKICGFMIELKDKTIINTKAIESISVLNDIWTVSLSNDSTFKITEADANALMAECKCMDLEARIAYLQSCNVSPDDYKKI